MMASNESYQEYIMKFTSTARLPLNLSPATGLNVEEPDGATLRVLRGRVWLTQEGSQADVFLDAGSGYTFREGGRVVISAEGAPATIAFDAPLSVSARAPFGSTLKRFLTWYRAPASIASNAWEGI
jgi:hypothetical protein